MKAPDFDYLRPSSLDAALAMLAEHDGEAMPLAGGQSLMPMMNFRVAAPEALIDLADLTELRGITVDADTVRIGAMTRYAELMSDPMVQAHIPLIGMALPHIAHDAVRNRGTIGGSLALADPAAEMPALMLALDASIEVAGPDATRMVKADDFFLGMFETALDGELITAIHVPVATPAQRFGFHELTQRHGDYALAGVAIAQTDDSYRAAFFGVADRAIRVPELEAALTRQDDMKEVFTHLNQIDFTDDLKANHTTRQRLAGVALTRALKGMTA
jgi:carbon-monoxide dehydrogenase medium subunit